VFPCLGAIVPSRPFKPKGTKPDDEEMTKLLTADEIKLGDGRVMCGQDLDRIYTSTARFCQLKLPLDSERQNTLVLSWDFFEQICEPYLGGHKPVDLETALSKSDLSKDSGMPWNLCGFGSKKLLTQSPLAMEAYQQFFEGLAFKRPTLLTQVNGKEELLQSMKLLAGKQRTIFAMCAFHFFALAQMSFDLAQRIGINPFAINTALFLSIYNRGAEKMATYMGRHEFGFSVDIGAMDASCSEFEIRMFIRMFVNLMAISHRTKENIARITHLLEAVMYTILVMPDGNCFLKGWSGEGGSLSGQYLTAILNTFIVITRFMYAWVRLGFKITDWQKEVSLLALGDDVLCTASKRVTDLGWRIEKIAELLWRELRVVVEFTSSLPQHFTALPFLAFQLQWDHTYDSWGIRVDFSRVISSLVQGPNKGRMPIPIEEQSRLLKRLCSIRVSTFTDPETRDLLQRMIREFVYNHRSNAGNPFWEEALLSYHTNTALAKLWYGMVGDFAVGQLEGTPPAPSDQ